MGPNTLKLLTLVFLIIVQLAGCQNFFRVPEKYQPSPQEDIRPGKKLVAPRTEVWINESCESRKLPYLFLDHSEIVPKTAKPGATIRYRLSYTACIPQKLSHILGRLETKVSFQGKTQSKRSDDKYTIETGKWIVDTHIAVPKDVTLGTYVLDATLLIKGGMLQDHISFNVER